MESMIFSVDCKPIFMILFLLSVPVNNNEFWMAFISNRTAGSPGFFATYNVVTNDTSTSSSYNLNQMSNLSEENGKWTFSLYAS